MHQHYLIYASYNIIKIKVFSLKKTLDYKMTIESENYISVLESNLFRKCDSGKSGTVFIVTNNNKSCQIVLSDGKIVAFSLGVLKGSKAAVELSKVGFKRASFTENMQFPLCPEAEVDSSEVILELLGYTKTIQYEVEKTNILSEKNSSNNNDKNRESLTVQTYRGHVIEIKRPPKPEEKESSSDYLASTSNEPPESARIYRGQVIEDQ